VKHISTSPLNNSKLQAFLSCKDHSVSNETFSILRDETSDLLITSPRPDLTDLSKYYESAAYISHTDARKTLFDRIYQVVRNHTIRKKIRLINSFGASKKTVLDIGAGTGDFLHACKKANWFVEGIEPNEKARGIAELKLDQKFGSDISELAGKTYDVITMWHVLEHVPNLEGYLEQLNHLLKENGKLVIAVPNHNSFDANYYGKYWAAYDVPRHLWHFSQKAIKTLFRKEKMTIVKTIPLKFDAYYISLLSEKYENGNMNLLKATYVGWRSNFRAKRSGEYSSLIYVIEKAK
jgi:2-polyprenyl-3-methyl-5-hydroxy-6-metoxy-1,4-benzoquinol methylase